MKSTTTTTPGGATTAAPSAASVPTASATEAKSKKSPLITAGAVVNYRDSWRIFRIITEFVEGYQFLAQFKREVTILGSARLPKNNKYYKIAEELGYKLGQAGFTVITGGGPSIMEAANKGAHQAGGESVGLNIQLPFEQRTNDYVKKSIAFYYFFSRKVMLTSPADAFIFFPGGFGTIDEFFEVIDNIEIGHTIRVPVVLVGKEFWQPVVDFLRVQSCARLNAVTESELQHLHIAETASQAFEYIKDIKDQPNISNICATAPDSPYCQGGLDWKIFRIMAELVDGFEFITKNQPDVTILGTKSILSDSEYYQAAYKTGQILARQKYAIATGGGPGIMEAASKGAFEQGGASYGINMRFDRGERVNNYLTKSIGFYFPFVRKLIISAPCKMFVFFPGGLGTMHHLFEILTLLETDKIEPVPVLLYGRDFWQPLLKIIHNLHAQYKTIAQSNEQLVKIIDKPEEVLNFI